MRPFGTLSWLIVSGGLLFAAAPLTAEVLAGYRHTGWTEENGAPAAARALAQSSDGFLWMAAGNDVYRFDGVSFVKMPALRDPELGDLQPQSIHTSPSGDIWIGYRPGAVALYRHGMLRDLHIPDPPGFIAAIEDDGTGGIWALSERGKNGLFHFTAGRWATWGARQGIPAGSVHKIFVARDGTTWAVQPDALLFLRRGATRFEKTPAMVADGGTVAQAPDGRLWLADMRGVRPLPDYPHGATDPAKPELSTPTGGMRRLVFDRAGNLWGTDGANGIFRIAAAALDDPEGRASPDVFKAAEGLTSNRARSPLIDREGNLWLGTENGIDRLRTAAIRPQAGIPADSSAYAGVADRNGIIFVEADTGIYSISPGQAARRISTEAGIISPPCRLADGSVMTATPGIFNRLLADRTIPGPGQAEVPTACVEDASGRLWFLGLKDRLTWRDADGWHSFTRPEAKSAIDIFPGPDGVALANIASRYLMRLDPARPTLTPAARLGVGAIVSAYRGDGGLLVSGSRGLARLRDGRVQAISGDKYPWLNRLRGMIQTRRGDTWMLSLVGIVRVATSDLDRAFARPDAPLPYRLFDAADGMSGRMQKNGLLGSQIFESTDGAVRFLTSSGVVVIDPAKLTTNALPPPVAIASLTSGGSNYLDPTDVRLPAGASNVAIAYSALSLSVPGRVRFRYRLEGVDAAWVDPGTRREAVYSNLGPGVYRFRVIAANNDGVWNPTGATLRIEIPPTFAQSIWFKLLCAIAAAATLWWAYSIRVRQLTERLNATMGIRLAERERIARELHDTLLQAFQGLVLQFQAAANRIPAGGPARQAIDQALKRADIALAEGRDRVRDLRMQGTTGDLARSWTAIAAELGVDRAARFELIVEGRPRALHPLVEEELQRLGEEALRNAFRHARARTIEATLTYRADQLRFDIRDDGVGLPQEVAARGARPGHYGLTGMRERAQRIGGTLTIVSRDGAGTEILFSLAGKVAYRARAERWWERARLVQTMEAA